MSSNNLSAHPLVSVVIPSRNRPDLLKRAIESVGRQTYQRWEVVVVDDASNPPIEPVMDQVANVRIIRNAVPGGPARARNQGAAASRGELIAFLDDDDKYLPHKLEAAVRCLLNHPSAIGIHHHVAFPQLRRKRSSGACRVGVDPVKRMLHQQPPHPSGLVVWSNVHDRIRFDENFKAAADLDYCLRLALEGPLVEIDEVLAEHGSEDSSPSLIALDQRIAARQQFRAKHEPFFRDRRVAAFHDIRLAHLYRRSENRASALRHVFMALRKDPTYLGAYSALLTLIMPKRLLRFLLKSRT